MDKVIIYLKFPQDHLLTGRLEQVVEHIATALDAGHQCEEQCSEHAELHVRVNDTHSGKGIDSWFCYHSTAITLYDQVKEVK